MNEFFRHFPDMYTGSSLTGLEYFGPLFIGLLVLVLFFNINDNISDRAKQRIIITMGSILAISEISDKIYVFAHNGWTWELLSLHLCSISAILGVYLIFFNQNRTLYGIWFFWALQGAFQALLSPTVTVGVEYFKYWQFFTHHVLLVVLPITFIYFNNWIPTFHDVKKSYIWLVIISIPVMVFNTFTGLNYMFVSFGGDVRPVTGSPLDWLGPYPWYIISLFGFAFLLLSLTYLPIKLIYNRGNRETV